MLAVEDPLPPLSSSSHVEEEWSPPPSHPRLLSARERVGLLVKTGGRREWSSVAHEEPDVASPPWPEEARRKRGRGDDPRRRVASRAYFKLWEVLRTCSLPVPASSLHLCEAPGGFVQATRDAFPRVEAVCASLSDGERTTPSFHPSVRRHVLRTGDERGDLTLPSARESLVRDVLDRFGERGGVDLVTGDGGLPMDHDRLEEEILPLLKAQMEVAFSCLSKEGTLVLKVFECASSRTAKEVLAPLCVRFRRVSIIKPTFSRPSNSELYCVCRGFDGKRASKEAEDESVQEGSGGEEARRWVASVRSILESLHRKQACVLEELLRRAGRHADDSSVTSSRQMQQRVVKGRGEDDCPLENHAPFESKDRIPNSERSLAWSGRRVRRESADGTGKEARLVLSPSSRLAGEPHKSLTTSPTHHKKKARGDSHMHKGGLTLEQVFAKEVCHRRLVWTERVSEDVSPSNSLGCVLFRVQLNIGRKDSLVDTSRLVRAEGTHPYKREARRIAMRIALPGILALPDPCAYTMQWADLWPKVATRILAFQPPPPHWFEAPQLLGVDWEGCPPTLVQVACESGVVIDRVWADWVPSVLWDARHTHAVFGAHETGRVANPINLQVDPSVSLAETVSRSLCPRVRIQKDKSIHRRVDWHDAARRGVLTEEATLYAATDAEMTRRLGVAAGR